jgi:hypothetical protein
MQTTISLQEEPQEKGTFSFSVTEKENVPFSAEEPRAQTGLRSGKLAAHCTRVGAAARPRVRTTAQKPYAPVP